MAELSGFEVLALVKEIGSSLAGTYVNNIYSYGASQLVRFRKPDIGDRWLVVSPKVGVWVSQKVSDHGDTTEFTTKLRGELERVRFVGASQVDLDRVYEIETDGSEKKKLVVELMPPGNIVVIDSTGIVLLAMREVRSAKRRIVRGEQYKPPPQSRLSPAGIQIAEVAQMLRSEQTVGKAVGRHVAIPKKYVAETLAKLGVAEGDPPSVLVGREDEVVKTLRDLERAAAERPSPCICETASGDDIFVIAPTALTIKKTGATVSELCDELLLEEAGKTEQQPSSEENNRRELEATIANLKSRSVALTVEAARLRSAASTASSSSVEEALSILRAEGNNPGREPRTPAAIASFLFDKAKALETESREAVQAVTRLERRLPKMARGPTKERKLLRVRPQEWFEKFRWFFTSEGKLAVGGRDSQTNSTLLSRHTDQHDTVYHADLFGSPFFILKGGAGQSEQEINETASATVAFSSAWKTGLGSADAYWVSPEQVSTAAPSGEFLPRGSFSIRGRKNFVRKNIVELALGLDKLGRVMAGPENAVRSNCQSYIVIRPQREKASDTAKQVLKELSTGLQGDHAPTLDDVLRALPSGGGKVVRRSARSVMELP